MDSILWTQESDHYTNRALTSGVDFFDPTKFHGDEPILIDVFSKGYRLCKLEEREGGGNVLDVGCCAGGTLTHLHHQYPQLNLFGIDPGKSTIGLFNEKNKSEKIQVKVGYGHELAFEDQSFDIAIFSMVLQWIPRKFLMQTIAELDRVLKPGGAIVIEDFLPDRPVSSVSRHDPAVKIFKEDYPALFTAFPWYKEEYREVKHEEQGVDFRKVFSLIRKLPLPEAYFLKEPPKV